jgi:hypothetical protein
MKNSLFIFIFTFMAFSQLSQARPNVIFSAKNVFDVASSYRQLCAIVGEKIVCYNTDTQAGPDMIPPQEALGFTQLSLSINDGDFGCAVTRNGKIICWGQEHLSVSLKLPEDKFYVKVQIMDDFGCALDNQGVPHCANFEFDGEENKSELPQFGAKADVVDIVANAFSFCVLKSDGQVQCFGEQAPIVPSDLKFSQISKNHTYLCGVLKSGEVRCFDSKKEIHWSFMDKLTGADQTFAIQNGDGLGVIREGKAMIWSDYWAIRKNPEIKLFADYTSIQKVSMGGSTGCVLDIYRNLTCISHNLSEE